MHLEAPHPVVSAGGATRRPAHDIAAAAAALDDSHEKSPGSWMIDNEAPTLLVPSGAKYFRSQLKDGSR